MNCAHCPGGPGNSEVMDPESIWYWHCDCWGGQLDCCRCEQVKDPNCACDECKKEKHETA